MTISSYLDRYNVAATKLGVPALKSWKSSKQALVIRTTDLEAKAREAAKAATVERMANELKAVAAEPSRAQLDAPTAHRASSAASIIAEFGINPKVGRALLRKHNVARTPKAIRAFFKSR